MPETHNREVAHNVMCREGGILAVALDGHRPHRG